MSERESNFLLAITNYQQLFDAFQIEILKPTRDYTYQDKLKALRDKLTLRAHQSLVNQLYNSLQTLKENVSEDDSTWINCFMADTVNIEKLLNEYLIICVDNPASKSKKSNILVELKEVIEKNRLKHTYLTQLEEQIHNRYQEIQNQAFIILRSLKNETEFKQEIDEIEKQITQENEALMECKNKFDHYMFAINHLGRCCNELKQEDENIAPHLLNFMKKAPTCQNLVDLNSQADECCSVSYSSTSVS